MTWIRENNFGRLLRRKIKKQVCLFPMFFRMPFILSIPAKSLFYNIRVCSC